MHVKFSEMFIEILAFENVKVMQIVSIKSIKILLFFLVCLVNIETTNNLGTS